MKTIDTLVEDIHGVLLNGSIEPVDGLCEKYGELFAQLLKARLQPPDGERRASLRMSSIGKKDRQLWYMMNMPEAAEPLTAPTKMKFLFGDVIELLLLFLSEVSGHTVEGAQDEVEIAGVKGHRDAVIDGTTVDVKSASSYSFKKFADGTLEQNDPFGYVDQIQSYLFCGQEDPIVTDKDQAAFLVVDKQLGRICLDKHPRKMLPYLKIYEHKKRMVESETVPERCYDPVPDGKSRNMALDTQCSYCEFKKTCWPSMRTFIYSNGPKFLVHVEREPNVPEVT